MNFFGNFRLDHILPSVINEEDIVLVIDEIVIKRGYEKTDTERETYESIKELKFPQDYDDGKLVIWEYLNEKEMNNLRVQAMFKDLHTIIYQLS